MGTTGAPLISGARFGDVTLRLEGGRSKLRDTLST